MIQHPLAELVVTEARGEAAADQAEWLRYPENLDQWRTVLVMLLKDIDAQHGSASEASAHDDAQHARGDIDETTLLFRRAERATWRRKALRFRSSIETRLIECNLLLANRRAGARSVRAVWLALMPSTRLEIHTLAPGLAEALDALTPDIDRHVPAT